jgi:hypothetical protein
MGKRMNEIDTGIKMENKFAGCMRSVVIFKSHEILLELSNHGVCLAGTGNVAGMAGGGGYIISSANLLAGEHELHLGNTTCGGHRRCTWR